MSTLLDEYKERKPYGERKENSKNTQSSDALGSNAAYTYLKQLSSGSPACTETFSDMKQIFATIPAGYRDFLKDLFAGRGISNMTEGIRLFVKQYIEYELELRKEGKSKNYINLMDRNSNALTAINTAASEPKVRVNSRIPGAWWEELREIFIGYGFSSIHSGLSIVLINYIETMKMEKEKLQRKA